MVGISVFMFFCFSCILYRRTREKSNKERNTTFRAPASRVFYLIIQVSFRNFRKQKKRKFLCRALSKMSFELSYTAKKKERAATNIFYMNF